MTTQGHYEKAEPVFNVRDYGAKGDGITDDTDAINRALAAAVEAADERRKGADR